MGLLNQSVVYHPEPWQDRDWAGLSGLPLEDVWFQTADGARLFDWHTETQTDRPIHTLVPRQCPQNHQSIGEPGELYRIGLSVFIFNYHGYGRSQGRPLEEGFARGRAQSHFN